MARSWCSLFGGSFNPAHYGHFMVALGALGALPLPAFFALSAAMFFSFSMIMPNFGALAMEPLGEVAGTASSTQGFLQMVLGAAIGAAIGQFYDGTVLPLALGFLSMAAVAGLCIAAGRTGPSAVRNS